MLKQAVILCGGVGKRLMPLTKKIPKPMVRIKGKPFLYYLISDLKKLGFSRVLLLVGYKANKIKKYFGDGRNFNIDIKYHEGPEKWETGKRVFESRKFIDEKFLLLYSDNIFSLNYHELITKYKNEDILFVLKKKIPGNFFLINNKIKKYSIERNSKFNFIELGFMICKKKPMINFLKKKKQYIN
jgi:NDP-sugar pyrophosphorylase family protein